MLMECRILLMGYTVEMAGGDMYLDPHCIHFLQSAKFCWKCFRLGPNGHKLLNPSSSEKIFLNFKMRQTTEVGAEPAQQETDDVLKQMVRTSPEEVIWKGWQNIYMFALANLNPLRAKRVGR